MLTIDRAARARDDSGTKLPVVWPSFDALKVHRRRGQLHLTSAAPGTFKSTFALNEAIRMKVPCLYLAMDLDGHTAATRVVQMLSHNVDAEQAVTAQEPWAMDYLRSIPWVYFAFPESPDMAEITQRVFAFAEMNGEYPHWVVVDNVMDVTFDGDEQAGYRHVMAELAKLARMSKAGVHALHHVIGEHENGDSVVGLKDVLGKVSKKPTQVLTIHRGGDGRLRFSVVKTRFGPADPSGHGVQIPLRVAPEIFNIWEVA